jgi:hypothetical protein
MRTLDCTIPIRVKPFDVGTAAAVAGVENEAAQLPDELGGGGPHHQLQYRHMLAVETVASAHLKVFDSLEWELID